MIDRVGLSDLTPARRAQLIYSEAQAELSKRLWQAALGDEAAERSTGRDLRPERADNLDSLLAALTQQVEARGSAAASTTKPFTFPKIDRAETLPVDVVSALASTSTTGGAANVNAPGVNGLGPNSRHTAALQAAAARTGIAAPALAAIVDAEAGKARDGSWQVYSRNPRSSAAGLGQFLSRTWEGLAETKGTWLNGFAKQQGWLGNDGQVRGESRTALLAARYDATASINSIADYARRNLDGLKRAGVSADGDTDATARLAYLGHHLGLGDAVKFVRHKGLDSNRARVLLGAQVGSASSQRRIAEAGDATAAHRSWLLGYLDRKIRPDRFAAIGNG